MSELFDNLSRDTLPPALVEAFVNWCVFEQARPAMVQVLEKTGLHDHAERLRAATTYAALVATSETAGHDAHEARKSTGPLGLSTAEAAAFLVSRVARAATELEWDPEGVAFFAAQVCGWAGFAASGFSDFNRKNDAEQVARTEQEAKLSDLWQQHAHE